MLMLSLLALTLAADPVCTPQRPAASVATRASKYDSTSTKVGTAVVKVCYSRPLVKGRTIFGSELVPYGKLWRTGANEPTTLHLDRVVRAGDLVLRAGSYSIYTVPGEREWTIILNRATRQWGIESDYTPDVAAQEVGRFLVRARPLHTQVERLTFRSEPSATAAVDLVLEWQGTEIRLPFDSGFAAPDLDDVPGAIGPD